MKQLDFKAFLKRYPRLETPLHGKIFRAFHNDVSLSSPKALFRVSLTESSVLAMTYVNAGLRRPSFLTHIRSSSAHNSPILVPLNNVILFALMPKS